MMLAVSWADVAQVVAIVYVPLGIAVGALLWQMNTQTTKIDKLRNEVDELRVGFQYVAELNAMWSEFVACVAENVTTTAARQDWHLALLDRLIQPDGETIDRAKALHSDRTLSNDVRRRLMELDLFVADPVRRRSAARGLANGVGDEMSVVRLGVIARSDPELADAAKRLATRLANH